MDVSQMSQKGTREGRKRPVVRALRHLRRVKIHEINAFSIDETEHAQLLFAIKINFIEIKICKCTFNFIRTIFPTFSIRL